MKIYCFLTICIFTLIICRNVLPDNVFDSDFYSVDIDNVADIFVLASVDEEDIHFTYFT